MRVLQVFHGLATGGAETWLLALLRHWKRQADEGGVVVHTDVLLTGGVRETYDDEAEALGATLFYCASTRRNAVTFARRLRHILKAGDYDAIHDHGDYISGWHFLIAADLLPPVRIAHVHNPWLHIAANYAVSPGRRLTTVIGRQLVDRFATHVCGTSAAILQRYGFQPGRTGRPAVGVAHCGFRIEDFNAPRDSDRRSVLEEFGWPSDAKVILFAGRLDRSLTFDDAQNHKNSWLALNIAHEALKRDPAVRLIMAGAGDEPRRLLTERVAQWGRSGELRLVGVRSDIPRLMRAADLLLFPSREEGLGMVAVEAQAAGLPVLASTAVPAECVVVRNHYDALGLDTPPEVWASRVLEQIGRPRPSLEFCRQALKASPFAIERSALRLEAIYSGSAR